MRKLGGGGVINEIRKTRRRDFGKHEFSFRHVGFEVLVVCPGGGVLQAIQCIGLAFGTQVLGWR